MTTYNETVEQWKRNDHAVDSRVDHYTNPITHARILIHLS